MNVRPDQIASWDITRITEEVKEADIEFDNAAKQLESAELMLKATRSKFMVAKQYQNLMRDFAKSLLSTRDPKTQERSRSKYQKKLADYYEALQKSQGKESSRKEVEGTIGGLMDQIQTAAAQIAKGACGEEVSSRTKKAKKATITVIDQAKSDHDNGGGHGDPEPSPA